MNSVHSPPGSTASNLSVNSASFSVRSPTSRDLERALTVLFVHAAILLPLSQKKVLWPFSKH